MRKDYFGVLERTSLLSFEISSDCNLRALHPKCAINHRKYKNVCGKALSSDVIVETINKAKTEGFTGMVAFHYYNEPLLNKETIMEVINSVQNCKFLLWTNGTLLDNNIENNAYLSNFSKVCITCYSEDKMDFYETLKDHYHNIEIFDWELDDRVEIYNKSTYNTELSCKRPLFELPIDYYGNIHLCCMDWNNMYEIGNIFQTDFLNIIHSERYTSLLNMCSKRNSDISIMPSVCKGCDKIWLYYPHYFDE